MIWEKYEFIGEDGSLGLENGKDYYISIMHFRKTEKLLVWIQKGAGKMVTCPYSNERSFKKNWKERY